MLTTYKKEYKMQLALLISVVSICGFAGALSYNVYEFRKVGRSLDEAVDGLREMDKRGGEKTTRG